MQQHVVAITSRPVAREEASLVARAQQGDRVAYEMLVAPRLGRLMRLTGSILANEADASDAVQEACLKAWQELPRLRDADSFEAWLWRIAVNGCRTALRGRRRAQVREIAIDEMPPGFDPPHSSRGLDDRLSQTDLVERAFRRLEPDKRAILVLHHIDERSGPFGWSPMSTCRWRGGGVRRSSCFNLEGAIECLAGGEQDRRLRTAASANEPGLGPGCVLPLKGPGREP